MKTERGKKKLLLKKRTVSFLTKNQMDNVIGATGDECYSATCPGDRGCPDTNLECPTSNCTDTCPPPATSVEAGCPPQTSLAAGCPPQTMPETDCDCGPDLPTGGASHSSGWCTQDFGCGGFNTKYISVCTC